MTRVTDMGPVLLPLGRTVPQSVTRTRSWHVMSPLP